MDQLNYINKPIFGHGALDQISLVLADMGIKKPLICTDQGIVTLGMLDDMRNLISNEFAHAILAVTKGDLGHNKKHADLTYKLAQKFGLA